MITEKTYKREITAREWELIEAVRRSVLAYPNGYPQLEDYARDLFEQLIDPIENRK